MARSPQSINGLIRWGRADSANAVDGAAVSSIVDRVSGTIYTPIATGANGATYVAASSLLNNKPALSFDGQRSNALRDSVGLAVPASGWTVWAVYRRSSGGNSAVVLGADDATSNPASSRLFQLGRGSTTNQARLVTFNDATSARIETVAAEQTSSRMLTGIIAGPATELYSNGLSDGPLSSGANTQNPAIRLTISNLTLSSNAYQFVGLIAEWGVYDHALTAAERSTLHSYVQDRYAIAVADYKPDQTFSLWTGAAEVALGEPAGVWNGTALVPVTYTLE